jgi:hypothetical protein
MAVFRNSTEIIDGAIAFTTDRLNALEKDLDHCLTEPLAPLPAIAYCFSTIDLMGALYMGNAMTRAPTTDQSKAFMMDFMKYSDVQATLLQKIFRHKVIHLATPKAVIEHDSKRIGWRYHHHSKPDHLKLNRFATTQNF